MIKPMRDSTDDVQALDPFLGLTDAGVLGAPGFSPAQWKAMFDRAAPSAKIGLWACRLCDDSLAWTPAVYDMFDMPRGAKLQRARVVDLYDDESRRGLEDLRDRAVRRLEPFSMDARIVTTLGHARWVHISASVDGVGGKAVRLFGLKRDITAERALIEGWRALAENDPLTGLANRARFQASFHDRGAPGWREEPIGALLLVDVDGFKSINDTFGHAAGDHCLMELGARLRRVFVDAALIARVGGDEFAVLMGGVRDQARLETAVRAFLALSSRAVAWNGRAIALRASVGVAMPADPRRFEASDLYMEADHSLYAAKAMERGGFKIFSRDLGERSGA